MTTRYSSLQPSGTPLEDYGDTRPDLHPLPAPNPYFPADNKVWPSVNNTPPTTVNPTPKHDHGRWLIGIRMLAVTLCQVACMSSIILVAWRANNDPLENWKFKPMTLTSALSALLNPLQAYMVSSAIAIIWWRECQRGTTIARLHNIWSPDISLLVQPWRWSSHGFNARIVGLFVGAILVNLGSIAVHPILQRALQTQASQKFVSSSSLKVDILPLIPDGLTANNLRDVGFDFTSAAAGVWNERLSNTRDEAGYRCPVNATCNGEIVTTGITASCSYSTTDVDLTRASQSTLLFDISGSTAVDDKLNVFFNLTLQYYQGSQNTTGCLGKIATEKCIIRASKTAFPVRIIGDTIAILPRDATEWNSEDLLPATVPDTGLVNYNGPLVGLRYQWDKYFRSRFFLNGTTSGVLAEALYQYAEASGSLGAECRGSYASPTEYLLNSFGEALFRLALNGNKYTNWTTTPSSVPGPVDVPVEVVKAQQVTRTDFKWLAVATVIMVLALLANLSMIWGWWELWRDVGMSPIECAQVLPRNPVGMEMDTSKIFENYGETAIKISR
jgi:hypothetical protein